MLTACPFWAAKMQREKGNARDERMHCRQHFQLPSDRQDPLLLGVHVRRFFAYFQASAYPVLTASRAMKGLAGVWKHPPLSPAVPLLCPKFIPRVGAWVRGCCACACACACVRLPRAWNPWNRAAALPRPQQSANKCLRKIGHPVTGQLSIDFGATQYAAVSRFWFGNTAA